MLMRGIRWCLKAFAKRWRYVRYFFQVLTIVRFGLLTVAIIAGAVLVSQQVADILRALVEDSGTSLAANLSVVSLFLAAFLCGLMVWYGARTMLRFRFMGKPGSAAALLAGFKRQLPRVLGSAVPLVLAVKVWTLAATSERSTHMRLFAVALLLEAAVLFAFVLFRRDLAQRLQLQWLGVPYSQLPQDLRHVRDAGSVVVRVYLILLALNVVFMVLFTLAPETGRSVGSMAILMIALTLVNATGSVIVYVGNRYRIPALSLLFLWALLSSFTSDNHLVRQASADASPGATHNNATVAGPEEAPAVRTAATVEDYFAGWLAQRANQADPSGNARPIPVFLVSAEGGGIRAAYWTAAVLGQLEDDARRECLPFASHVFAISGVSGGSLGAAAFEAALQSNPEPPGHASSAPSERSALDATSAPAVVSEPAAASAPSATSASAATNPPSRACDPSPSLRAQAARMLAADFLSPTVAAALFPDLFQRFVPVPLFRDRAVALERAWENAWSAANSSNADIFRKPFYELWSQDHYTMPLLFLNSTVVETGQRALVHPLTGLARQADGTFAPVRGPFTDALHIRDVLPDSLPLSTAVLLSARFTYVSPAGRIDLPAQQRRLRLVDGGYFDNSGAVTTQEIFMALERAINTAPSDSPARRVWPIVIHISNEPASDPPRVLASGVLQERPFAPEALSPIRAMFATRSARGFQARDHLMADVAGMGTSLHFRLYKGSAPIPLGWALSGVSRAVIDQQLNPIAKRDRPHDLAFGKYNDPLATTAIAAIRCYYTGKDCATSPNTRATARPNSSTVEGF